ncbi:protein EMBRYO DEFECTIVE 514-like [Phoenix dactylifera]|uniref:Protein EMBRYO DEFECTIVE 514-like n=1 Tax=Phoenix dactylifera TaxID=42345 RepID=A0A8B7BNV0_PHODC|nr:protein EMBRYO DEFECTIVE 514-like [Phoenix dactylifera]
MAEELAANPQSDEGDAPVEAGSAVDMELEASSPQNAGDSEPLGADDEPNGVENQAEVGGEGGAKREREEGGDAAAAEEEDEDGASKKRKVERSLEEERLEKVEEKEEREELKAAEEEEKKGAEGGDEKDSMTASLGPKVFTSSVEMFDYFFKLLHHWSPNLDINKYEHMVLLNLLQKGHPEPDKKIGEGIQAFQVRYHPTWKSRCFFIVRVDGTDDDFSFRKCIDRILPLPDQMKVPSASNGKKVGHQKGGGGGGRGGKGGRGQGGRGRGKRGRK